MIQCAAFLRGINVGGHNPLPMAALRMAFQSLGATDVRTYIQSGNVVFCAENRDLQQLVVDAEMQLSRTVGKRVAVILRTGQELEELVQRWPFLGTDADPARSAVVFLDDFPAGGRAALLDPARSPPDRFVLSGREIYLHCPNGFGRSKLTVDWFEKRLSVQATARNWRTVKTLAEWTRSSLLDSQTSSRGDLPRRT